MKLFNDLRHDERGIGMVTALAVAFIVFALGAIWVATANTELGQVTFNRNRTSAINAAEAGARRAMAELQNNNPTDGEWYDDAGNLLADGVRDEAKKEGVVWLGYDDASPACPSVILSADGDQLGLYTVRVERLDAADEGLVYRIESWGWGPSRDSRQSAVRKVAIDVELKPLDTFAKALFAAKSIVGTNRKEIYGDVYSGESVTISNFTRIFPNDPGETGVGTLEIFGDLFITNGSNVDLEGPLRVEGGIDDNASGTDYANVEMGAVNFVVGSDSSFKKAFVSGTMDTAGSVSGDVTGTVNEGVVVDAVPQIPLPTFELGDLDSPLARTVHPNAASFTSYLSANETNLSGIHIVPGPLTVDFKNTKFAGNFLLIVQDGDITVQGFTKGVTGGAITPVSVGIVLDDTRVPTVTYPTVQDLEDAGQTIYNLEMSTGFASIPGVVHNLIFSEGTYGASNQVTIYGTVYGHDDISSNRMEIHFRAPDEDISSGFDFVIPDATRFIAQPVAWRELRADEGTVLPVTCET